MAERPRARVAMMMVAIGVAACTSRDRADADAGASGRAEASAGAGAEAGAKGGALAIGAGSSRAVVDGIDAAVPVSAWVWKTYRGDRFSVLFPGEPKVTVLPLEEDKLSFDQAVVDVPGGQVSFLAGFTDHSQDAASKPDELLDEQENRPRRGTTEVLHKRSVTLPGGYPGRVLILRRNISGTPLRIYSRLYLVKQRLYSLIVSTLDSGGVGEDVVKKFMDSFKVL
jgi:hypothetical protein